eukprot:m.428404 g.428404  ORF g.428404 m.428404 type:complete len:211 (+) comp16868_c0_seq2:1721-2353(+)
MWPNFGWAPLWMARSPSLSTTPPTSPTTLTHNPTDRRWRCLWTGLQGHRRGSTSNSSGTSSAMTTTPSARDSKPRRSQPQATIGWDFADTSQPLPDFGSVPKTTEDCCDVVGDPELLRTILIETEQERRKWSLKRYGAALKLPSAEDATAKQAAHAAVKADPDPSGAAEEKYYRVDLLWQWREIVGTRGDGDAAEFSWTPAMTDRRFRLG